jgi:DNA-directed RNA polymerase subunit RPC12/RpoP
MGYAIMIDLTDGKWVCLEPCEHIDCAENRDFVKNNKCITCKERVLPNEAYYVIEVSEGKVTKIECFDCAHKIGKD